MKSSAGRTRLWRFATRAGAPALAAVILAGCAGARPDPTLPTPRTGPAPVREPSPDLARRVTPPGASVVRGDIRFIGKGAAPNLGPTVVALRPRHRTEPGTERAVRIVSGAPEFAPEPAIVRPGQPVILENRGPLVHRIFSPGPEGRAFQLPPGGSSAPFTLAARGRARFFCSLHTDERFWILAEDTRHAVVVSAAGTYRFGPLEAGRYTLWIWSDRVSGPVRDVVVDGYSRSVEPIWLDPALIER